MPLIFRSNKSSPLTYEEMDGNFLFLNNEIESIKTGENISDSYIRGLFSASGDLTYNQLTGTFSIQVEDGGVTSINGRRGDIILTTADLTYTTDDVAEGPLRRNLYFTEQRVIDLLNDKINVGPGLTLVDDENAGPTIAPKNFAITLSGDVTGVGVVSALGNVTIDTVVSGLSGAVGGDSESVSSITGITVVSSGNLPAPKEFTGLEFLPTSFRVVDNGDNATIGLAEALSAEGIINTVGNSISGSIFNDDLSVYTESGIIVTNDPENGNIRIAPRDFEIAITGAVSGSAIISRLADTTINVDNINNYIDGLDIKVGTVQTNSQPVTIIDYDAEYFDIDISGNTASVSLSGILTEDQVKDIVGDTVVDTVLDVDTGAQTESGIIVEYDEDNKKLQVVPRDFTISIDGAVSGNATISRLADTTISVSNINNYISGINTEVDTVPLNSVPQDTINFDGTYFDVTVADNKTTVGLTSILTDQDVRDIVGETVVGTEIDVNTGAASETGIIVDYSGENNVLQIAPRDFDITLTGAVNGTTTVSRLRDVVISTTSDFILGVDVSKENVPIANDIAELNFSSAFTIDYDDSTENVTIGIASEIEPETIRQTIGNALTGSQDGITVTYDSNESQFGFILSNLAVELAGAVTGTATLAYSGAGTQSILLNTEVGDLGSGVEVRDEGEVKGSSISAINFVGAGVTSSVTVDGQVATVNVPNSPANEKFLLIDSGSANVPNARRLLAGTGIVLNDNGAGNDLVISASGGQVLGKIQVEDNGELVGEEPTLDFVSTQQVFSEVVHDSSTNKISVFLYSKDDGWYRDTQINHGDITDKYGNSLDLGNLNVGIIEQQINFGDLA